MASTRWTGRVTIAGRLSDDLALELKDGHTTASVALRRLAGFRAKNGFYRANRDLGRILKTEFILQYMSEPARRTRIRRGLLKVEQMHALARWCGVVSTTHPLN